MVATDKYMREILAEQFEYYELRDMAKAVREGDLTGPDLAALSAMRRAVAEAVTEMAALETLAADSRVSAEGIGMRVRQHFQKS